MPSSYGPRQTPWRSSSVRPSKCSTPFQTSLPAQRRPRNSRRRCSTGAGHTRWRPVSDSRPLRSRRTLKRGPCLAASVSTKCEHMSSSTGASLRPGDGSACPRTAAATTSTPERLTIGQPPAKDMLSATITQSFGFGKTAHAVKTLMLGKSSHNARHDRNRRHPSAPRRACRARCSTTPCVESRTLSEIVGAQVFLKFENLQFTASFKERGACNKLVAAGARQRRARRDRHVGRQPCAGRGLPRAAARPAGGDRDAALHARREDRAHPRLRRRGGAARRHARRRARPRLRAGRARAADLRASLRRRSHHRRPGHGRARDAATRCPTSTRWWSRSAAAG